MFNATSGAEALAAGDPAYKPDPAFPPRVLAAWPIEEGYFGARRNPDYEFGADALDDLRYLHSVASGELANASIYAENALANSSDTAAVRRAADNLETILTGAQAALLHVTQKMLREGGRGFQIVAQAFGEVAGEVQAWPEGMPRPIQEAVKQFTLQWRDVAQDASKRFFQAERVFTSIMEEITTAAALQYRLWQLLGALYEEKINELTRRIEQIQAQSVDLRAAGDQFVKLLEKGAAQAERALRAVGNTLGLSSVGPILAIGAALALLLVIGAKGGYRRR